MNHKFGADFWGAKERNTIRNKIHSVRNIKAILTIQKKYCEQRVVLKTNKQMNTATKM